MGCICRRKRLFGYACISFTLTGFFWLMFLAMRSTTALNTGVIFTLVPGISGLYSAVLLKERLGKYRLIAMIPATLGAIWVLFHGDLTELLAFNLNSGDLIFSEAACSWPSTRPWSSSSTRKNPCR